MTYSFPDQFQWGVATSAYQIEGATAEEGRSPSVWDQFRPSWQRLIDRPFGTYRETRQRGAEGCDPYHRYPDDIQLIKSLGTRHYRFSTSWCRIVPDSRGHVNQQGLDFYDRLVDKLLENNIEPLVTLFHWDSPQLWLVSSCDPIEPNSIARRTIFASLVTRYHKECYFTHLQEKG